MWAFLEAPYMGGNLTAGGIAFLLCLVALVAFKLLDANENKSVSYWGRCLFWASGAGAFLQCIQQILDEPFLTGRPRYFAWSFALAQYATMLLVVGWALVRFLRERESAKHE